MKLLEFLFGKKKVTKIEPKTTSDFDTLKDVVQETIKTQMTPEVKKELEDKISKRLKEISDKGTIGDFKNEKELNKYIKNLKK